MSRQLNSGQNHSIKLDYKLFESVVVANQSDMLEENSKKHS
jgi:hypothetical protein